MTQRRAAVESPQWVAKVEQRTKQRRGQVSDTRDSPRSGPYLELLLVVLSNAK